MDRLTGKIILISGGARGQGAAEARLCVEEGARVVIGDVLEDQGRKLGPNSASLRPSCATT
jgi:3alpha(or 20beta)-hydroxysteroid dehydrogenase